MPRTTAIATLLLLGALTWIPTGELLAQRGGGRAGGGRPGGGGGGPSPGHRTGAPQPASNRGPAMVGPQQNRGGPGGNRPAGNPTTNPQPGARPGLNNPGAQRPGPASGGQPGGGQPGVARPGTAGPNTANRPSLQGNVPGGNAAGGNRAGSAIGQRPANSMNDFFGGNAGVGGGASNRPGLANNQGAGRLPGPDNRPGLGNDNNRNTLGNRNDNRTNVGDRNTQIGDRNNSNVNVGDRTNKGGNTVINTGDINVGNKTNYNDNRQQWVDNRHNNGNTVRNNAGDRFWNGYNNPNWHAAGGYAYWGGWGAPGYGWQAASWAGLGAFMGASLAAQSQPVYYAYGTGGNVAYDNGTVYVNGEAAGTSAEYAQQAQSLVQAAPPADQPAEWMPLGVFALTREGVADSQAVIELAVTKTGVLAGTYHNEASGVSRPVKGSCNFQTQRAALGFADGKNTDVVLDTGLFNLTQDEAPAMLHFGTDQSQPALLVRLQQPEKK